MIWLAGVSYATAVPLRNWGVSTLVSNVHRLRACAGSWMSRTTTVGSPTTVPITRLSPAGTDEAQWTEVAIVPGVEAGALLGVALAAELEGVLVAVAGPALVCAAGVAPPPQETRVTIASRAAPAVRTR